MGNIVTTCNLYLLNSTVFEVRLINSHLVGLSTLIIYAGQVEEVTNFTFFTICVPPGRIIFKKLLVFFKRIYKQGWLILC